MFTFNNLAPIMKDSRGRKSAFEEVPIEPFEMTHRKMNAHEIKYHASKHRGDIIFHFLAFDSDTGELDINTCSQGSIKINRTSLEAFVEAYDGWKFYCFKREGVLHFMVINTSLHGGFDETPIRKPMLPTAPQPVQTMQQVQPATRSNSIGLSEEDIFKILAYTAYTKSRNGKPLSPQEYDALTSHYDTCATQISIREHGNRLSPNSIDLDVIDEPWPDVILELGKKIDLSGEIPSTDTNEELKAKFNPPLPEEPEDDPSQDILYMRLEMRKKGLDPDKMGSFYALPKGMKDFPYEPSKDS